MGLRVCLCSLGLLGMVLSGCASSCDSAAQSLISQQSVTIESLQREIIRLNQELAQGAVPHRDLSQAAAQVPKNEGNNS